MKSPVVHPLSAQQLTKWSPSNSFVLIMIHSDGGCPFRWYGPGASLTDWTGSIHSGQCQPRANRMLALLGSSVDIGGENDIPKQRRGGQELHRDE